MWFGKVKVRRRAPGAQWTHDPNCTSGALVSHLPYCQGSFPQTQYTVQVPADFPLKPFATQNCKSTHWSRAGRARSRAAHREPGGALG